MLLNKPPSIQTLNQLEGCQAHREANVKVSIENQYWRMRLVLVRKFFKEWNLVLNTFLYSDREYLRQLSLRSSEQTSRLPGGQLSQAGEWEDSAPANPYKQGHDEEEREHAQTLWIYIAGFLGGFSRLRFRPCPHKFRFPWSGLDIGIWDSECDPWTGNHYPNEGRRKEPPLPLSLQPLLSG